MSVNVIGLINSREVVATEVYDSSKRKQIKLMIPLLTNDETLCDFFANLLIMIRISKITAGCT